MKLELTEDELEETITALAHWRAYLISQGRNDATVGAVLHRLRGEAKRQQKK
jgi:hypothetical protein